MLLSCNSSDLLFVKELSLAVPKVVPRLIYIKKQQNIFLLFSLYCTSAPALFPHVFFVVFPLIRHFCLVCCGVVLAS